MQIKMLLSTFQHFRGFSEDRERRLWRQGVFQWDNIVAIKQEDLFPESLISPMRLMINESREALERGDADYFASRLARREHFRIAYTFPEETLFLDIETTGLSLYYDHITLVGWSIGNEFGVYFIGGDETKFRDAISRAKAVVTFNGSLFDLPFVKQSFPNLPFPLAHVDLRFFARRAGLRGGQKDIEDILKIKRPGDIEEIDGSEAPILWHKYRRGSIKSMKTLVTYNHADLLGLKYIIDYVTLEILQREEAPSEVWPKIWFRNFETQLIWARNGVTANRKAIRIPKPVQKNRTKVFLTDLLFECGRTDLRVVGIDLTGSEKRASGWCLLEGSRAETALVKTDDDLLTKSCQCNPDLVSIDSPLSLPKGRTSVSDDDPTRNEFGIMRLCERILKRRGINVYPCLLPSMQALTARGMRLATAFRKLGIPVIESYPGAAQDIMGIPRKRASLEFLEKGLREFGVEGVWGTGKVSHDELDAITSALVGVFFWSGRFEAIGEDSENYLIIPDLKIDPKRWRSRVIVGISGPIAAGKTTAGDFFKNHMNYYYTRFSLVLAKLLEHKHIVPTRETLQRIGEEMHANPGQRALCKMLLDNLKGQQLAVIDGLRHPDDHSYFVEHFGGAFHHIHVEAAEKVRRERYITLGYSEEDFDRAAGHAVETSIHKLKTIAHVILINQGTLQEFLESLTQIRFDGTPSDRKGLICL